MLKSLGRSDVGHKTMLDVLVPSLDQLRATEGPISLHEVREQAHEAALATIPMDRSSLVLTLPNPMSPWRSRSGGRFRKGSQNVL